MASWIVHLRIVEDLLERIEGLNPEQFGIGNIAPDSGVPDENWLNYDPPPKISHYKPDDESEDALRCEDIGFYHDHLAGVSQAEEPEKFSFLLGYFFHLITDNLWYYQIATPVKEKWSEQFEEKTDLIQAARGDMYGLDFIYVRDHPDSFYWKKFLDSKYPAEYLDHFPKGAIIDRVNFIKEMYQRTDEDVQEMYQRPYIYLSKEAMDRFIDEAVDVLEKVYRIIWEEGVSLQGNGSVLELL